MIGIKQIENFTVNGKPIGKESRKNLMRIVYSLGIEKNLLVLENEKLKKELEESKTLPEDLEEK